MNKSCLNCKKEFVPNRKQQLFCGRSCSKTGEFSPVWRGDEVGYAGVHSWIKKRFPKTFLCMECHEDYAFDLANISQQYRRDISDWEWLCRRCHMTKDGRFNKAKSTQFKKGNPGPWLGKHRSEETKKKVSDTLKRLGIKPLKPFRGGRSRANTQ